MSEGELVCPVCQSVPVIYEARTGELECQKCKERFTKDAFLQRTFDVQKSVCLQNIKATVEPLYRKIIPLAEKVYGPEHPNMVASLNSLADLLSSKGDYAGAEPLYRRALAIRKKSY